MEAMKNIDPENIIVIDESGSDLQQSSDYARAKGGKRAKSSKPHNPGSKYSIIGAISISAILAVIYIDTAINGHIFEAFIKILLKKLKPGQFVVMDNIKFHKREIIKILIESVGAKVVFLPPYSPDLSPIEKMWSKVKHIIKKLKPRTRSEFHDALFLGFSSVDSGNLASWYEECGYNIAV